MVGKVEIFPLKQMFVHICCELSKKHFSPMSLWSLQLHLRSLSPAHRNLCFLYCAIWCLWCLSKLSLSLAAPTPAAVHTACLPPAPNACITCKLCCIHLAQTALIWALWMSTHEISVLLLALVSVLVILFCSPALFLLYSFGKSAWVCGTRLCLLLWGPWWR